MADVEFVRTVALALPRTTEHLIRDHVKFRVKQLVYATISPDEERLGFGFPKEEREALVASDPERFLMPVASDLRYNWVRANLAALDEDEARELIVDAWRMVVPSQVSDTWDAAHGRSGSRPPTSVEPPITRPPGR